jgi:hypothetical protein
MMTSQSAPGNTSIFGLRGEKSDAAIPDESRLVTGAQDTIWTPNPVTLVLESCQVLEISGIGLLTSVRSAGRAMSQQADTVRGDATVTRQRFA